MIQEKYKIVFFNNSLAGGAGKSILTLAEILSKKNIEVHIIIYENKIDYILPKGIQLHNLTHNNETKLSKRKISIKLKNKLSELQNIDFIMSNSTPSNKVLSLLKLSNAYHCVRSAETKEHAGVLKYLKKYFRLYKYRILYTHKNIITISKGLENFILNTLKAKPKSIQTIYVPFNIEKIIQLSEELCKKIPKKEYVLHVGRFDMVSKRHDILLKAYAQSDIPYNLVLLGQGPDENKIRKLITQLNLEKKVYLPGFDENPFTWIKHAKLFIFSSDFEGFGRVLAEALVLKTPVVSTDCESGPREILTGALSDYLVPVGDVNALAIKIKEALDYYPDISEHIIDKFSDVNIANKYIKLIEENNVKSKT
jgi:glycosyltransferase involved in cell wall biosynthesis